MVVYKKKKNNNDDGRKERGGKQKEINPFTYQGMLSELLFLINFAQKPSSCEY